MSKRNIMDGLDAFIEYAEKTKKFADVGFYNDVKDAITTLQERIAELTTGYDQVSDYCETLTKRCVDDTARIGELEDERDTARFHCRELITLTEEGDWIVVVSRDCKYSNAARYVYTLPSPPKGGE